jgi:hypothetical protein
MVLSNNRLPPFVTISRSLRTLLNTTKHAHNAKPKTTRQAITIATITPVETELEDPDEDDDGDDEVEGGETFEVSSRTQNDPWY